MSPVNDHRRKGAIARRLSALTKRQRIASGAAGGAVVLALVAVAAAGVFSSAPRRHHHPPASSSTTTSTTAAPAKTTRAVCPLTGTAAPHGKVPKRPAIGIKIGNDPASRPQTGLLHADIVYEEMAEGGITRYLAIFQCHQAPVLGPARSVRWTDWHVLKSYGHPILAFSGGITYWDTIVANQHWLFDANGSFYPAANAYYRTSNRVPPWNLYTSTSRLWALDKNKTPPPAQFVYHNGLNSHFQKASQVSIDYFAGGSTVVWKWNASAGEWFRYLGSSPDTDSSGVQLHAKNVIVEMVVTHLGPYAESGSTHGTDSLTRGSGVAYVLRNGHYVKATWRRPAYHDPMGLYLPNGKRVTLTPGNTWVEMVPLSYAVHIKH